MKNSNLTIYFRLFIPFVLVTAVMPFMPGIEKDHPDVYPVLKILLTAAIAFYYLVLNNMNTPFIKELIIILAIFFLGEALFNIGYTTIGKIIVIGSSVGFAACYFLRQVMKDPLDKLRTLKIVAVTAFCWKHSLRSWFWPCN